MAFDFKKEFKEFYMPKNKPEIVNVPKANYIAVRGKGNPNEEGGAYQHAISILYAVAYTLKMSYKTDYKIKGFFEYVVPPLEGFWWQDDVVGVDYTNKSAFNWISVIRLPDFISKADFDWAIETATKKKKIDCSSAEYLTIDEGLCVQIMHIGFRRELYVPAGGPDGGNGGHGGDIIFQVDKGLNTLGDFRHNSKYIAQSGEEGGKKRCTGKNGEDLIIKVPEGTVIYDDESGKVIADMSGDNMKETILKGGRGGKGNMNYATATMQAPQYAQPGQEAKELWVRLELKCIADPYLCQKA